jgi:DNA-binding CsgD family transcriptional regulator
MTPSTLDNNPLSARELEVLSLIAQGNESADRRAVVYLAAYSKNPRATNS